LDNFQVELELMKARIAFYFAAVVALVLFLAAAVPSHATQHRDPSLTSTEMVQRSQPAVPPAHAPEAAVTPKFRVNTGNTHNQAKAKKTAKRASPSPVKSGGDLQGRSASSLGTK
jgi:hypothetical protein